MYQHAIIRSMSQNFKKCISSHPLHSKLDLKKAINQHKKYKHALVELGLDVIEIEAEKDLPDCVFVEDTAIIYKNKAIISRMKTYPRQKEIIAVKDVLKQYFSVKQIERPGFIEGGDVLHLKNNLLSGLSQRTNLEGIKQSEEWLGVKFNYIRDPDIIHLKSHVSRLDENTILCTKKYADEPIFFPYEKILVPDSEPYAANVLEVNGTILVPLNFDKTEKLLKENGYDILSLDTSEFQKCDGALTCLSLLF